MLNAEEIDTKIVQKAIHSYMMNARNGWVTVPNCYIYGECDVLAIDKYRFSYEFEIKRSRADFLNDIRASNKILSGKKPKKPKEKKHNALNKGSSRIEEGMVPNYYIFCVPITILDKVINDIPEYAGLYSYDSSLLIRCEIKERQIHDRQVADKDVMRILRNLHFRYWKVYN